MHKQGIQRRTDIVGLFPNDATVVRPVGAMMLEQNDEWGLNRRYMQLEGLRKASDAYARVPSRDPRARAAVLPR